VNTKFYKNDSGCGRLTGSKTVLQNLQTLTHDKKKHSHVERSLRLASRRKRGTIIINQLLLRVFVQQEV
jgi:hypothetical protein